MIRRLLVANRGEIARRIFRTCRELGIEGIAVYSDADAGLPHVREADRAVCIGPPEASASYLDVAALLDAARRTGADAIHPGYGFLAENADFATAVIDAGLAWVGPPPQAIAAMGDKAAARQLAQRSGVPVVPGFDGSQDEDELANAAEELGFPVLIKAVAGGGGRGMRRVDAASEFAEALASARREAVSAFGNGDVLLERYVERPRHVEIQVLADAHGTTLHLGERECSIQRRHQKVIKEAPSPAVDEELRARMGEAACAVAQAAGYVGAGTVEFIPGGRRAVLLPRDEHPAPGRAPRHRAGDRRGPGRPAARRGRGARAAHGPGRDRAGRPRHRGAAVRRRTRCGTTCRPPGPCSGWTCRTARASASTPATGPATP